jgi:hypothetical protein
MYFGLSCLLPPSDITGDCISLKKRAPPNTRCDCHIKHTFLPDSTKVAFTTDAE